MSGRAALRPIAAALVAVLTILAPAAAWAKQGWAGYYRVSEGPDVGGELLLRPDGSFAYVLAAGALDQQAQGSWREDGDVVRLTTEPKPRPPVLSPAPLAADAMQGPLRVKVTTPSGRGIAGVTFTIGFAAGEPVQDYTQEEGWQGEDSRQPLWIEAVEPIYDVVAPRVTAAAGQRAFAFILTPNDIGVVDFVGAVFERADKAFVLHFPKGDLRLRRQD